MSVTAAPTLTVAGLTIAASTAGGPSLVAVDALRIGWGRSSVLEQPIPATASLIVLDRSRGATFASRADLIGQKVVLGWATSDGFTGTNFRGRVTDVIVTPLPDAVAGRGFRVALTCSSLEVDLANYLVPDGTVFPAETFAARRSRIMGYLPAGVLPGSSLLPGRFDLGLPAVAVPTTELDAATAAQQTVSSSVLELLRQLYNSTSPLPMIYDPVNDGMTFARRQLLTYSSSRGLTMSARLLASPDHGGRYVPAGLSGAHLDAGKLQYSGSLHQPIDTRLTRVEVSYLDATQGYASRTATAATSEYSNESTTGRRALTVDSTHADGTNATRLASLYVEVANIDARLPRLAPLGYSSAREPFHDAAHATLLLSGMERSATVFLGGSWLPQLGARPLVGILGATITYSGGQWDVEFLPTTVLIDPQPYVRGALTIAALASSTAVRLADLDPSLTLGDLGHLDVGAGYTTLTALPYKGNPS